jgi:hypothetical protein
MDRMKTKSPGKPASRDRSEISDLEDIPNVGAAVARDLRLIGIRRPVDAVGRDPYRLYDDLCRATAVRHDPCMLDTFIAIVRFMEGAPAKPWWAYTAERKRRLGGIKKAETKRPAASLRK